LSYSFWSWHLTQSVHGVAYGRTTKEPHLDTWQTKESSLLETFRQDLGITHPIKLVPGHQNRGVYREASFSIPSWDQSVSSCINQSTIAS